MSQDRDGGPGPVRSKTPALIAGVVLMALVVGGYALHVQPGYAGQGGEIRRCRRSMGLVSTALLRYVRLRGPDTPYPATLDDLIGAGMLHAEPGCALSGAFRYRPSLDPDMPMGTIVLWEEGPPHRIDMGKDSFFVLNILSTDLGLTPLAQRIDPKGEATARERLEARLARTLGLQAEGVALAKRARRGDETVWREVRLLLRGGRGPLLAAFAACAAGRADRSDMVQPLCRLLRSRNRKPVEPALSAAWALARMGRLEGAGVLVAGLEHERYIVRRRCFRLLSDLARKDFGYRPYLPSEAREDAVKAWETWWREQRP